MIDKEKIIIGGVDVSKCRFLDVERDKEDYPEMGGRYTAYECILTSRDCECSKDCYYKQLNRKEQALNAILELVEENKNTCQYQGICKSILEIIKQAKGNNQ